LHFNFFKFKYKILIFNFQKNSLAEIKLILMMSLLNENIKSNEIDLFKLILNKFILDEKYRSPKIKKAFLYLAKVIISNKKIKDFIYNENFLIFLSNNINESNNIMEIITNQSNKIFNLNLIQRFSIEIIIVYLLKSEKEDLFLKTFAEKLIITLNSEYSSNNLFHYNNLIFKQIFKTPSTKNSIFDKNNYQELIDIYNFINIQNNSNLLLLGNSDKNTNLIIFSMIFPKYHLIKLYKIFLKLFFEKKHIQTLFIINMIKDLIQNQLSLYSCSSVAGKPTISTKSDALTKSEENKDDLIKNLPLLCIRNLDKTMHVNLKIFLIKSLTNCLKITLFNISKISQNVINANCNNNIKNNSSQRYLEFLNHFMSISMVLILSEECWDIKVNGVNLLIEIIKRFSRIKDDRVDDNSLLIQQYEAQISSCIKMIFGNNFSIESLFKGMNLLYCYICIPITTDYSYVKKIDSFIDIDLHKNNPGTIFSEKYDHFFITKKLKFFCRLYMTSLKSKKMGSNNSNINLSIMDNLNSICVFNSNVSDLEIYGENLENTNSLEEYFDYNLGKFFKNLFDMLNDFNIILNSDPKFAKNYKNYEYLASGNRIAYSYKKVHKYSQFYLKILSFILVDKRTKSDNFLEKFNNSNEILKINDIKFDSICEILLYHINHFSTKNSQNFEMNMICISDFNIYSDNDITFELREKIILNAVKITEMIEILNRILLSEVKLSKKIILNILNYCFFLIKFSIKEFEEKILYILEYLVKKIFEKQSVFANHKNDIKIQIENLNNFQKEADNEFILILNNDEKKNLLKNLTVLCFNYYNLNIKQNSKSFLDEKNYLFLAKIIEIVSYTSNLILYEINSSDLKDLENKNPKTGDLNDDFSNFITLSVNNENDLLNDFLVLCKIQLELFVNTNCQQVCKLSAAKLFIIISKLKNMEILKLFYDLFFYHLSSITQFDRYFILYYMILQNISKKFVNNQILENEKFKFENDLVKLKNLESELSLNNDIIDYTNFILMKDFKFKIDIEKINFSDNNLEEKEKIFMLIKSLSIACNNNFDNIFKNFFENILFYSFEERVFLKLISYEEFQSVVLTFTITIENDEKRKNLILILLLMLNEKFINSSNNEITRLALISLKLISKDLELIAGIAPLLDSNFLTQINNLAIIQRNQLLSQGQILKNEKQQQGNLDNIDTEGHNSPNNVIVNQNNFENKITFKEETNTKINIKNINIEIEDSEKHKTGVFKLKALKFGK